MGSEFRFRRTVRCQRVGVVEQPSRLGISGCFPEEVRHRRDRAAGNTAGESAYDEVGVAELTGAVPVGLAVEREHRQIRRDGIEPAGVNDARTGVDGLLVVEVNTFPDEQWFAGQVGVVGSRGRAGGDQQPLHAANPDPP